MVLESSGVGAWTFRPTSGVDLGLKNRAGLASAAPELPQERLGPRPASSTGGLVEALDAADVARGLGHGGPVRSAVDLAASSPEAPTFGTATFAVALGSDGSVNGVLVTVKVDASEQFPGGGRPTPDSKQGVGARASLGGITETKDHVEIELPSASVAYRTRSCGVGLTVNPGGVSLGGGCEPGVAMSPPRSSPRPTVGVSNASR